MLKIGKGPTSIVEELGLNVREIPDNFSGDTLKGFEKGKIRTEEFAGSIKRALRIETDY